MLSPILSAAKSVLVPGKKYLLAVSGGIDSVVLLNACKELQSELFLQLAVAHVDHGLRTESAKDADFVRQLALKYEIPFYCCELSGAEVKVNIENWARTERYKFLKNIRKTHAYDFILTAHTASDCVETLLMRLLANKEPRNILAVDKQRKLLRPLLEVDRAQIAQYANDNKLQHVEDTSNLDNKFLRNKIRNNLIPVIAQHFGADAIKALFNRSRALAEDQVLLDDLARQLTNEFYDKEFGSRAWMQSIQAVLASAPEGLQWRIVKQALDIKLSFILGRISAVRTVEFLLGNSPQIQLPGGYTLKRKAGGIEVISL